MNHLFNKKRKKIFEQGLLPGTPTNTAGPVSHRAESSIGPEGAESHSYRDQEVD